MGIRFLCPNGHKLNVKAFLAGERGICPQCDAKFLVPHESGGQVETIDERAATNPSPEPSNAQPPPVPRRPAPAPTTVAAESEAWYVRTAEGDQYGPASLEMMQDWVAEGRVANDCWVWRAGWPDWKTSSEALSLLDGSPTEVRQRTTTPRAVEPVEPVEPVEIRQEASSSTHAATTYAANAYRLSRRNRQERARKVTLILGGVVVLLLAVLVGVLIKNSG